MTIIDLAGDWAFHIDQDPEYHRHLDYSQPTPLHHWERVPVPGCWNRYAERYDLFEGVAWFVREFDVEALPTDLVATLHFGAVNYLADVFLNGCHLGRHEGGYTAFAMDAAAALRPGANRLAVRVDNRHLRLRLPAVLGWYNYGGLHRGVRLHLTRRGRLTDVRVSAAPAGAGATGRLSVAASAPGLRLHAVIRDPAGHAVWSGESDLGQWQTDFSLPQAEPWSPDCPRRYHLDVRLSDAEGDIDRHDCRFGIRRLEAVGQQLRLNGEPVQLRGLCYLYDHPACGVAWDPGVAAADLDDLQALGVNCLRSHFPLPEPFLDACDERGLMLWLEVPIYCLHPAADQAGSAFADTDLAALARQMVGEMVQQAHNHPSVVIWSVGNECNTDHPESVAFFRDCVAAARALDPDRLISYAALYGGVGHLGDLIDVVSLNEYWGWYDRIRQDGTDAADARPSLPLELPQLEACLREKAALGKPVLLSEFGADAEPGFRSDDLALWSEDYQAALIARQLAIAGACPAVCGTFPFLYNDYRDPSKPVNHHWHGVNLKGVVGYDRRPKLAWQALQAAYGGDRRRPE